MKSYWLEWSPSWLNWRWSFRVNFRISFGRRGRWSTVYHRHRSTPLQPNWRENRTVHKARRPTSKATDDGRPTSIEDRSSIVWSMIQVVEPSSLTLFDRRPNHSDDDFIDDMQDVDRVDRVDHFDRSDWLVFVVTNWHWHWTAPTRRHDTSRHKTRALRPANRRTIAIGTNSLTRQCRFSVFVHARMDERDWLMLIR